MTRYLSAVCKFSNFSSVKSHSIWGLEIPLGLRNSRIFRRSICCGKLRMPQMFRWNILLFQRPSEISKSQTLWYFKIGKFVMSVDLLAGVWIQCSNLSSIFQLIRTIESFCLFDFFERKTKINNYMYNHSHILKLSYFLCHDVSDSS